MMHANTPLFLGTSQFLQGQDDGEWVMATTHESDLNDLTGFVERTHTRIIERSRSRGSKIAGAVALYEHDGSRSQSLEGTLYHAGMGPPALQERFGLTGSESDALYRAIKRSYKDYLLPKDEAKATVNAAMSRFGDPVPEGSYYIDSRAFNIVDGQEFMFKDHRFALAIFQEGAWWLGAERFLTNEMVLVHSSEGGPIEAANLSPMLEASMQHYIREVTIEGRRHHAIRHNSRHTAFADGIPDFIAGHHELRNGDEVSLIMPESWDQDQIRRVRRATVNYKPLRDMPEHLRPNGPRLSFDFEMAPGLGNATVEFVPKRREPNAPQILVSPI